MAVTTDILKTEFNEDFVQGMRNRMVMSYYKYGKLVDAFPEKIDALQCVTQRLREDW